MLLPRGVRPDGALGAGRYGALPAVALAARVAVAVVLVVAALSKLLLRNAGWISTAVLGIPPNLLRWLLIGAEFGFAVALLTAPAAGSVAAVVLLAAMTIWLFRQLGSDEVSCRCFGAMSNDTVGWPQIVRNACLIGLSVLAGGSSDGAHELVSVIAGLVIGMGVIAGGGAFDRMAADRRS